MLEEWVAYRIYRSTIPKQGQVKPETISSYLSALKSYHIDCHLSLEAFDTPRIALIIKGEKRLFPKQKATRLPITKDILEKITENKPINIDDGLFYARNHLQHTSTHEVCIPLDQLSNEVARRRKH